MTALPSGTITFLFTDIEGSTRLWETHPNAMRPALARHDALVRDAVALMGGIVFKTVGDAFCTAFAAAPDALAAATKAQIALLADPLFQEPALRVRMALHTGLAQERDNDYFGPVLHRVSRLLSAGHGGQTLISAPTYELLRDCLPEMTGLMDLGLHRLKDLERPEHVFLLTHPDLPALETFPPLRTLDNTPNNLPQQVTSFIGREKEIAEVRMRLGKTHLLTLTGSGGSGKTRLALQVAADVLDGYSDGAWLVEFGSLSDPALVPQTIASVLGVKEQTGQTLLPTLSEHLRHKHALLVLDNCEHLLSACAQIAAAISRSCPQVQVLATSREPLGIAGEATYRVPPLSLPNRQQRKTATPQSLSQFEAVRLFLERAELVKSDFAVTNANAPALAQLCFRVDGIPLAIELAAARVRSLSIEQINDKLDSRFRLLTGGDRSALPRQQTLRALVDWSYDLLTEPEKIVFARLSVFAGGWTLAAAEAVCGFDPIDEWDVLDYLTSLVDKSLIAAEEDAGETRYRLLESLKQYGTEKRVGSDESTEIQNRHRDYFVTLAEEAKPQLRGPEQLACLNRLETEHDNLRAAMEFCTEEGDAASDAAQTAGLRLAGALWRFWFVRGYFTEGREQIARALEQDKTGKHSVGQKSDVRAVALNGAGFLAVSQGDYQAARVLLDESLSLSRASGNPHGIALSLNNMGNMLMAQGDFAAARSRYEESLALRRALGDRSGIATSLMNLGGIASRQGDYVSARSLFEESLAFFRAFGEKRGIALSLLSLANLAVNQGDSALARSLHTECLALFRELGDKSGVAYSLNDLGDAAYNEGDYGAAQPLFEECLALFRDLGDQSGIANSLHNLGLIALHQGDVTAARAQYEKSLDLFCELGEKKGIAYALEGIASVFLHESLFHAAAVLWSACDALRAAIGTPLTPVEQAEYREYWDQTRSALGEAAFSAAWEKGRMMDWERAIGYALTTEFIP